MQNKFLGWTRAQLTTARTAVQNARMTGVATKVDIAGVDVEFDPRQVNLNKLADEIQYSISQLPDADPDNPLDANPYNKRPGITRPVLR